MTIDTSREAVERILENVTPWAASEHQWPDQVGCCPLVGRPFSAHKNMLNVTAANTKADIHFIAAARDLVPALLAERDDMATLWQQAEMGLASALAERDAALAEVARLSTPPDDAEVLAIIEDVTFEAVNSEIDRVLAGRICQKLARLFHALAAETAKREAMEAAINGMVKILDRNNTKGPISDVELMFCWLAAQDARATLAKHGSK